MHEASAFLGRNGPYSTAFQSRLPDFHYRLFRVQRNCWPQETLFYTYNTNSIVFITGLYNYPPMSDVETGESKGTFATLTRSSNELLTDIHNSGASQFNTTFLG